MSTWAEVAGEGRGAHYSARFASLAATGQDVHGEARRCAALVAPGARILDAGCGTGRVAIRLAELGYRCTGVDCDPDMLAEARRAAPELDWRDADLASFEPAGERFDLVVMAGNVLPLVDRGTEPAVLRQMSKALVDGGLLVAGFGLDAAHLPLPAAPFGLDAYDEWCRAAQLVAVDRYATWDGDPYDGGGYAVSVHRRERSTGPLVDPAGGSQ
jgi:SAM-dependent methyltransferase